MHKGVGCGHYAAGHMAEEGNKLTLRRLEAPIHKFIKVALPTDLERLQKHHSNILKVTAETWLDVGSYPKLRCISVCLFFFLIFTVPAKPAMGPPPSGAY